MRTVRLFERHARHMSRRGVAVVVALGLLAITLTISYTLLRTQSTSRMIAANASRSNQARQVAMAGIQIALKKIHEPSWQGVNVPLTGNTTATDSYRVTFATGDSSLTENDPAYQEYPYRLTLRSTGTSTDPSDANRKAEHTIEVVVQLVRERMTTPSATWNELLEHTFTQWADTNVEVNFPCRIEGSARINGNLDFCPDTPGTVRPFDGLIDEVALVERDLSEGELLDIYQGNANYTTHLDQLVHWWKLDEATGATSAYDQLATAHGIHEGATSGASPSPFGGSGSARFDGEVDGISLGSIDLNSTDMTIMAWLKADDFGSADARIISKSNGTDEADHWWMLSTTRSGLDSRLRFRLKNLFGSTRTLVASAGDLPTGQWVFAAATYDGFRMKLYVNGELVGSEYHLGGISINSSIPAWIGDNASGSPRGLYFRHLNQMIDAGHDDLRPFSGPLTTRANTLDQASRSLISEELGIALVDDPTTTTADYSNFTPPDVSEYQLYPGGANYTIPALSNTLSNRTLEADMPTNPLGVFRATSNLQLNSNVTIQGVLLGRRDVDLVGSNIQIQGIDLPALQASTERVQLPCLCVGRRLDFLADSTVESEGMIVVADETRFKSDDSSMTALHTGRLATAGLDIEPRAPWANFSQSNWNTGTYAFEMQRRSSNGHAFFPAWLASMGISSNPHIQIVPPSATIRFHWHDWSEPLFLPKTDGQGLRWNIIRWNDQT